MRTHLFTVVASLCLVLCLCRPQQDDGELEDSPSRPHYIGCVDSRECETDECCMLGGGRYSIPRCTRQGDLESICRPSGRPHNANVTYPDNAVVSLTNVYLHTCPCMAGLQCSNEATCQSSEITSNSIDNFDSSEDK